MPIVYIKDKLVLDAIAKFHEENGRPNLAEDIRIGLVKVYQNEGRQVYERDILASFSDYRYKLKAMELLKELFDED